MKRSLFPAEWSTGPGGGWPGILRVCAVGCLASFFGPSSLEAATLRVPESYASIQAAIDAAHYGDQVVVSSGTYFEQLLLKSGVSVAGLGSGSNPTLLIAPADLSPVVAHSVSDMSFSGFRIEGTGSAFDAPLMLLEGASITVRNNVLRSSGGLGILATQLAYPLIDSNFFEANATGIELSEGSDARIVNNELRGQLEVGVNVGEQCFPEITGNVLLDNAIGIFARTGAAPWVMDNYIENSQAEGVLLDGASAMVWNNLIFGSGGSGVRGLNRAQPNIQHNQFSGNAAGLQVIDGSPLVAFNWFILQRGPGIWLQDRSYPAILHNVFQDNGQGIVLEGGIDNGDVSPHIFNNTLVTSVGVGIHCVDRAYAAIDNNIIAFNHGNGLLCTGSSQPTLAYNLLYGNGGTTDGSQDFGGRCQASATDISADPLFVALSDDGDPSNDDLNLQSTSPAVDAGNPQEAYNDPDGTRNDLGAYGGPDFPSFVDMDGDGYTTDQGDCNDADPRIHPAAQEVVDGIDNDCDGGIDEPPGGDDDDDDTSPGTSPTPSPGVTPSPTEGGDDDSPANSPTPGEPSPGTSPLDSPTPVDITYGEGCNCDTRRSSSGPNPGTVFTLLLAVGWMWAPRRRS